ncbi:071d7b63-31ef-400d-b7f1-7df008c90d85 [Thermothielavioides terrestris]|uniref:071d7b63-31ef-400d-b7f1-7df008c90d85 n=1 Tax=Thermothielavioides terrestris TaxID=2587410 RepID=A0A446BYA6_9PEZI|nr:071d7b63-31ef-400d-b7f1-7df008c90d85 [Thermothielavioides terrestris]
MATELAFAKSFLSLLDSKPTKISADHVEDPRSYPGSTPYIIPRHPTFKPFSKRPRTTTTTTTTATSSSSNQENNQPAPSAQQKQQLIPVTLRSPRNPPLEVSLPPQPPTTSLGEIKELFAARTGLPVDKVKLLFGKKPVGDSKALGELLLLLGGGAGGAGAGGGEGKGKGKGNRAGWWWSSGLWFLVGRRRLRRRRLRRLLLV